MIKIKQINNGFILENYYYDRDNDVTGEKIYEKDVVVFEDDDNEYSSISKLLEHVANLCGYPYDKYGNNNINIKFNKKGHKLE